MKTYTLTPHTQKQTNHTLKRFTRYKIKVHSEPVLFGYDSANQYCTNNNERTLMYVYEFTIFRNSKAK